MVGLTGKIDIEVFNDVSLYLFQMEKDKFKFNAGYIILLFFAIGFVGSLIYTIIDCSHKHTYDDREGYFEYYE